MILIFREQSFSRTAFLWRDRNFPCRSLSPLQCRRTPLSCASPVVLGTGFFTRLLTQTAHWSHCPPVLTQRRGELLLQLWQGQVLLDQQKVRILAGRAAGVIETYAGPRTIEALSGQKSMVVAVPKDRFGNPLPDGQSLQFHFRYPATGPETEGKPVENLIGVHPFEARSLAGKITMGVEADEARAEAEELRITPAWANRIRIRVEEWFPYADGRQNVKILTEKLRDPAGNLVSDGNPGGVLGARQPGKYGPVPQSGERWYRSGSVGKSRSGHHLGNPGLPGPRDRKQPPETGLRALCARTTLGVCGFPTSIVGRTGNRSPERDCAGWPDPAAQNKWPGAGLGNPSPIGGRAGRNYPAPRLAGRLVSLLAEGRRQRRNF
jgi:hypothetical protein